MQKMGFVFQFTLHIIYYGLPKNNLSPFGGLSNSSVFLCKVAAQQDQI